MNPPLHFGTALLPDGWHDDVRVVVAGGRIARIETGMPPAPDDERHAIAVPGLGNLHSHAFQRGMAGLAERRGAGDDSFWTWREVMYRFLERMGPDDLVAIAAFAYVEMLETGFTRVGEFHYLHHDPAGRGYANPAAMSVAIAEAAAETGIALTLLPVFYAHGGFGGQEPTAGQRRFLLDLDGFARLRDHAARALAFLPDAVLGLAPHSLRATTPDELTALAAMAGTAPIHIHIAEQTREVDDCLAWSGARPVEWLFDHAPVDRRWCLVHATHMTPDETRRLAQSGAVAGLCPITEANLGDGLFPARDYADGAWGVGSDSNVLIDAAEELRLYEYGQRLFHRGRNMLAPAPGTSTGAALFGSALAGGATALGTPAGIAVGHSADLVTLAADHPCLIGRSDDALIDGWLFAAGRGAIDCVWRHGVKLVSGGRHHAREAIVHRYRAALSGLLE
ncbi:formimidoylglutamate deiminase [Novosphingobium sp. Fuku2-ISO-50]|uniref:formimidoylglutamate deiminase n=1 Tax=Novosphingobium sp. Fuku2-ISO-50 TaxID=1739114 RepID=UPI00076C750E|nr:formimidoylglutamate deiminase [Novosphingobium sp. Fuku2-ISO-50]KUR79634.1 N-formimino-L-glutamate deiminase [Novosphingobium sp. Fuku2-ISO-50]